MSCWEEVTFGISLVTALHLFCSNVCSQYQSFLAVLGSVFRLAQTNCTEVWQHNRTNNHALSTPDCCFLPICWYLSASDGVLGDMACGSGSALIDWILSNDTRVLAPALHRLHAVIIFAWLHVCVFIIIILSMFLLMPSLQDLSLHASRRQMSLLHLSATKRVSPDKLSAYLLFSGNSVSAFISFTCLLSAGQSVFLITNLGCLLFWDDPPFRFSKSQFKCALLYLIPCDKSTVD